MPEPTPAERRALFAQEFQGTTNLDQRRRFAQELSEAKARSEERDQALFEQEQRKNPKLMQAVTGRARERRMAIEGMDRADLAERKFTWDQEKAVRTQGLQERSLALRQMQEERLFNKAERDLADAEKIEADTLGVEEAEFDLRERNIMPGSSAYRDGVLNILARSPYVDPNYRRALVESAKINLDADELQAQLADLQEKFPGASFTIGTDGRPTIRQAPQKAAPNVDVDAELAKAYAARNRAKKSEDEDYRIFTENRIRELEKLKAGGQQSQQVVPASVAADGMATNLAPGTTGQPQSAPAPKAQDSAAVEWARANSSDPRAKKILEINGIK